MSFVTTLNRLMQERQTSNVALGKAIGVSDVAVMRWKKGEAIPSLDNAISIANYYGISLDDLASDKLNLDSSKFVRIPVIGTVLKFGVNPNKLWTDDYITIDTDDLSGYPREECFALKVNEDDLLPNCFSDLSYLIFHQQSQCASGDKVIIHKTGSDEYMFKIFKWNTDSIELLCTNPDYKTITYRRQDINKLCIDAVMISQYDAI